MNKIEKLIAKDGFWDNPEDSKILLKERTLLSGKVDSFKQLASDLEETEVLLDLAEEESDSNTLDEVAQQLQILDRKISKLSLDLMLDGENDKNNAIVSINAGAGGTEAQDWAEMLFRMYGRWVERRGFKTKLIDLLEKQQKQLEEMSKRLATLESGATNTSTSQKKTNKSKFKPKKDAKKHVNEKGERLCFKCDQPGHMLKDCPSKRNVEGVATSTETVSNQGNGNL